MILPETDPIFWHKPHPDLCKPLSEGAALVLGFGDRASATARATIRYEAATDRWLLAYRNLWAQGDDDHESRFLYWPHLRAALGALANFPDWQLDTGDYAGRFAAMKSLMARAGS